MLLLLSIIVLYVAATEAAKKLFYQRQHSGRSKLTKKELSFDDQRIADDGNIYLLRVKAGERSFNHQILISFVKINSRGLGVDFEPGLVNNLVNVGEQQANKIVYLIFTCVYRIIYLMRV